MLKHFKDSCVYLLKRRTFVEEISLITSKAKQRCLYSVHTNRTSPMTGASQFQRRFRENKVCSKGIRIKFDEPVHWGESLFEEYESTSRVYDDFGNLEYTELI